MSPNTYNKNLYKFQNNYTHVMIIFEFFIDVTFFKFLLAYVHKIFVYYLRHKK